MHKKLGVGLGQKLIAGCLAIFVLGSLTPAAALAADLSSPTRDNVATTGGVIRVGNGMMTIRPGDMLTDAQLVALSQVLSSGRQTLLLNTLGVAAGGRFNVTAATGSLVIPQGVTALQNISATNALNLSGNLANSGSYYLYSTNANIAQANLAAANIFNNRGALLTSALPNAMLAQMSAISRVDLNLTALQSIINQGTISSSGNLNLTAGQNLVNSGVLQAANNLGLATNDIQNSGLISALN